MDYSWNEHGQLASVKSLAGTFTYEYDPANPALLTKMTGPVHEVETTYEPHRNLIASVTNRANGGTGILPVHRDGPPGPQPADHPSLIDVVNQAKPGGARSPLPAAQPTVQDADGTVARSATDTSIISSYVYANDLLGRRETISQGGEAFAMLKLDENKIDVAYNERSEVVGASYRSGKETQQKFEYDYDGIGNRKRSASEIGGQKPEVRYETSTLNHYTSIRSKSPSDLESTVRNPKYDQDGNLIEDERNWYTWDSENHLIRVDSKDGSLRLDFVYDFESRRTVRTETRQPGTKNEEQKSTFYVYEDWNLHAELSPEDADEGVSGTKYYTWGRDLSGSLKGAGGIGGLLAISKGGVHRNSVYDANGNVGQMIGEGSQVTVTYAYGAFGKVVGMVDGGGFEQDWCFSTKPVDAALGFIYYGYRWYDSETGRWISRDPLEELGGSNLYVFARNDWVGRVDLLGQQCVEHTRISGAQHIDVKNLDDLLGTGFYEDGLEKIMKKYGNRRPMKTSLERGWGVEVKLEWQECVCECKWYSFWKLTCEYVDQTPKTDIDTTPMKWEEARFRGMNMIQDLKRSLSRRLAP